MDENASTYWSIQAGQLVMAPTLGPRQVALTYVSNWVDPLTGLYMGSGFVLRLLGSEMAQFLTPGQIDAVSFADGTVWTQAQFPQQMQQFQESMPGQIWLTGSSEADYLQGSSISEELIYGSFGNDVIDGGAGNDMLDGAEGSDTYVLRTGGDSDTVLGWTNMGDTDRIVVAPGIAPEQVALFWSEGGPDPLTGQYVPSGFVLRLLGSSDEIRFQFDSVQEVLFSDGTVWSSAQFPQLMQQFQAAMPSQQWLNGSPQADYLEGGSGNEYLYGSDGNDVLDGGAGNDMLDGSLGSDTYVLRTGGDSDMVFDWANSGETNRIVVAPGFGPEQVALFWRQSSTDPVTGEFHPSSYVLRLLGSSDEIRFQFDSVQEVLFSDGTVWNQAQFPQLMQQFQAAMPSQQWLNGSPQADYLEGGSGNEYLYGSDGNDVLDGGAGNDMLEGGNGSDTFVLRAGGGSDSLMGYASEQGTDRIVVAPGIAPEQVALLWSEGGPDPLTGQYVPSGFVLRLLGSHDEIRFQPDAIQEVLFSDGTVWNQAQFPQLMQQFQAAMPGQGWLTGYSQADYLQGASDSEHIYGGDGNDVIDGGAGNDVLDGSLGSDTYVLRTGGDSDMVFDWANSGETNRIVVAPGFGPEQVALFWRQSSTDPVTGEFHPSSYVLRLLGSSDEIRFQFDSVQEVLFSDGTVWNQAQFPQLMQQFQESMPGQMWLTGSSEADYLQGASDSEHIFGGDGNDVIDGGAGNDMLNGGQGSDTYVLRTGGGSDTVLGWTNMGDTDRIVVAPGIAPEQVALFWSEGGPDPLTGQYVPSSFVLRLLGSNDEIRFQSDAIQEVLFSDGTVWNQAQFPQLMQQFQAAMPGQGWLGGTAEADYLHGDSGNEVLDGNAGNDVLDGGAGSDMLNGGQGSDTYVLRTGGGSDTINDFATTGDTNRIVVAPGIGPEQVELYVQDYHIDPVSGQPVFQTQTVLRLSGTQDEIRFMSDAIQAIVFADGTQWGREVVLAASLRPNSGPTGEVLVQGEAEAGQTLQASHTLSDADGMGTVQYQWLADGGAIAGATEGSYTLTTEHVGRTISVEARYVDGYGTPETVASVPTLPVAPTNLNWTGSSGADVFVGSLGHDTLSGLAGNDTLTGRSGNDALIGGAGTDRLDGGEGSDLYLVSVASEHTAAEFVDSGAQGVDEVRFAATASSTLTLYAGDTGVERVVIGTGTGAVANSSGTLGLQVNAAAVGNALTMVGNAGNNRLTGTAFADTLDGGLGVDTLVGGAGNDTYWVNHASDVVSEGTGAGMDTVLASVGFTLSNNVERLTLLGTAAMNGNGNTLNNWLIGNGGANVLSGLTGNDVLDGGAGADKLNGGRGNDVLTGGAGNDVFRFADTLGSTNVDTISDWATGDRFELENAIFTKLTTTGVLAGTRFAANASGLAMDANDHVVYNTSTGALSYDADGSGAGAAVQIAMLVGIPALSATDFTIT